MTTPLKIAIMIMATLLLFFVAGVAFIAYEIASYQQGRNYFQEGYMAERNWQFDLARTKMTQALAKPLGNYWRSYALENRGYCYKQLYQREAAIRDFTEAVRLNPKLSRAWSERGLLYEEAGRKDQAVADYSRAIDLNPNMGDAFYHRGRLYEGQHKYKEARDDFREAVRCYPNNALSYMQLGFANKQLKNSDAALSNFEAAISFNPKLAWLFSVVRPFTCKKASLPKQPPMRPKLFG